MHELIVGPVLEDIARADFSGPEAVFATAFYSQSPLSQFDVTSARLKVLVRLDITNLQDWVDGAIDPVALLAFVDRQEARNVVVELRRSKSAHAKAYLGRSEFLVGSANFTTKGLSGRRHELLWRETGARVLDHCRARMADYAAGLLPMTIAQLRAFVQSKEAEVLELRRQRPPRVPSEDRPQLADGRAPRLGTFDAFIEWVGRQPGDGARAIFDRAHGKSQLSGHVRNCFFGGRQLLVADPAFRRRLVQRSPDTYRVFADPAAEARVRRFTRNEVVDEPGFSAAVWRNILPIELGGRVERRGGSIGSLNKTLPLLARYIGERLA